MKLSNIDLRNPIIRRGCHRLWVAILCVAWIVCVLLVMGNNNDIEDIGVGILYLTFYAAVIYGIGHGLYWVVNWIIEGFRPKPDKKLLLMIVPIMLSACDVSFFGDDVQYPGAPIVDLKKLPAQGRDLRYMISARNPVPYDIEVALLVNRRGNYHFDKNNETVRMQYPSDGEFDEENLTGKRIKTGKQVYVGSSTEHSRTDYVSKNHFHYEHGYLRDKVVVRESVKEVKLEILPWVGKGDNPYNVGKSKITLKP